MVNYLQLEIRLFWIFWLCFLTKTASLVKITFLQFANQDINFEHVNFRESVAKKWKRLNKKEWKNPSNRAWRLNILCILCEKMWLYCGCRWLGLGWWYVSFLFVAVQLLVLEVGEESDFCAQTKIFLSWKLLPLLGDL